MDQSLSQTLSINNHMECAYEMYNQATHLSIGVTIGLIAMHLCTSLKSKVTKTNPKKEESNFKLETQQVEEFTGNHDE